MTVNAVKGAGNVAATWNAHVVTEYCDTAGIQDQINQIDVTNLASSDNENLPGFGQWTSPLGGNWDATIDGWIGADALAKAVRTFAIAFTDATPTTVTYTWTDAAMITNYQISTTPTGAHKWSATLTLSGAPTRA